MADGTAQTALITGASVGIGLELARLLAAAGHNLILVSRDETKLKIIAGALRSTCGADVKVIPTDLSEPYAAEKLAGLEVDILINNAGFGVHGRVHEADLQKQLDLIQVNVAALAHLTRLFLPGMIERKRGRIMNVASVAAFLPGPFMAAYYASKAFVLSFSLALSEECRGSGVTVTAVCPGPTQTEFFSRAGINDAPLMRGQMMTAKKVAEIGYRAMQRGKPLVVTGMMNKLLAQSTRLAPRMMAAKVAGNRNRGRSG
jgi:short-subunit dehydrogenase